jgi:glycosyltransferase involved in cell wall biosynthesis
VLVTGPDAGLVVDTVNQVKVYRARLRNFFWHFTSQRPGRLARLGWHLRDRYNGAMRAYVKQVIEQQRPDVVVCHNLAGWSVSVWDEITEAGLPIVQVLHDMYLICPGSNMFKKGRCCPQPCASCQQFRKGHDARSAQVSTVVGVSGFMLEKLQQQGYFKGARGYVVHNASPYAAVPNAPAVARPVEPALKKAPLRFGYMGTLSDQKGVRWLIEQFQRLPFDATLQIAGRGQRNDETQLKALATSPNISFVGYQKPETFYRQIDVAVVPSIWNEPFGLVAVEGLAQRSVVPPR